MDSKTRSLVKRYGPFEAVGAYKWASDIVLALKAPGKEDLQVNRVVEYAEIGAEVREECTERLGQLLRREKVSEKHVRRLLASDRSDIKDQLCNVVRLAKRKANIPDLVATAIFWGDLKRRTIAIDYFGGIEEEEGAE